MDCTCCPASHLLSLTPHSPYHTAHFSTYTLSDVFGRAKSDMGMWSRGSWITHSVRYRALQTDFFTGSFPAPTSQRQDGLPRNLSSDAEVGAVGSAWSRGCAVFAVAGNLTDKPRREGCLGTTLSRWYRLSMWQPKFSVNGMYSWT